MTGWKALTLLIGLAAISAVGCCGPEKEQIANLTAERDRLTAQNQDYRSRINQLQVKYAQLEQENQDLRVQLAEKPEPQPDQEGWDPIAGGARQTLASDILFDSGKATLKQSGKASLNGIINDLKTAYANYRIRVYGFTDSDPIKRTKNLWTDNLDLSANRAMAVTRYLRENGIDESRIETVAMGATNFVAPNTSKSNKARNRRVEIIVVSPQ